MNDTARGIIDQGTAEAAAAAARATRPPAPGPAAPTPAPIFRDFKYLDDALGDLPKRFFRSARSLADRLDCREEWDRVEAAHDALRAHEPAA